MEIQNDMNEKCLRILRRMGDIKQDIQIPNQEYEELKNNFEILKHDFLHNLRVIDEKDKLMQKLQHMHEVLHIQLQKKDSELLEIRKEYEDLNNAQQDLYNAYKDVRKNFATSANEDQSKRLENSNLNFKNIETTGGPVKHSTREMKFLEKVIFLKKQLKEGVEENSKLHNQKLILQEKLNKSISIYKNEIHELKLAQNLMSQQHQQSLVTQQMLKEENLCLKNNLNQIVFLVLASSNAMKLKQISGSSHLKKTVDKIDSYNLIKMFICEISQKVNEYETHLKSFRDTYKENPQKKLMKQYQVRIEDQEEELNCLRHQNSILINVIKDLKQGQFISVAQQKFSEDENANHICIKKSHDTQLEKENVKNFSKDCKDFLHNNCSAEKLLITLNKKIESLVQCKDSDQDSEYQMQKLENHLRCLKDHLLHQLQEKISVIDINSVPDKLSKPGFSDARMLLLEEKINQLTSGLTAELASGRELLVQTLKDTKCQLANLQHTCQNIKGHPNENYVQRENGEKKFSDKCESEKLKNLEKKVQMLELTMQQEIHSREEKSSTDHKPILPSCDFEFPLQQAESSFCHLSHNKNQHISSHNEQRKFSHKLPRKNPQIVPHMYENANTKALRNNELGNNLCNEYSHCENIWSNLNEEFAQEFLS